MVKNDLNTSKLRKIDYFGKSTQFFFLVHTVVSCESGLGQEMASECNRGLSRTQKWSKKDLKMNCFLHTQKLLKNNENLAIFPLMGSVECKRLITAKNSTLELKTGPEEVKIMTKNDQK